MEVCQSGDTGVLTQLVVVEVFVRRVVAVFGLALFERRQKGLGATVFWANDDRWWVHVCGKCKVLDPKHPFLIALWPQERPKRLQYIFKWIRAFLHLPRAGVELAHQRVVQKELQRAVAGGGEGLEEAERRVVYGAHGDSYRWR